MLSIHSPKANMKLIISILCTILIVGVNYGQGDIPSPPLPPPPTNCVVSNILHFPEAPAKYTKGKDVLRQELARSIFNKTCITLTKRELLILKVAIQKDGSIGKVNILKQSNQFELTNEDLKELLNNVNHSFIAGRQANKPVVIWLTISIYSNFIQMPEI